MIVIFHLCKNTFSIKMRCFVVLFCFTTAFFPQIGEAKNMTAKIGENATLPCVFDKEVNCEWTRNTVRINYSVRGINVTIYNIKTKDCSLSLSNISRKDFARWQCCDASSKSMPKICMNIYLSETIIPDTIEIEMDNERIEQIPLEELALKNLTCIAKHGNPAPILYWQLNGHKVDGEILKLAVSDNNYTTTLKWNTSLDCDHIYNSHSSKLQCCVDDQLPVQYICDTVLLLHSTAQPFITLNGQNVSESQINFTNDLNSLENLMCSLDAPCHDSKMTLQLFWIIDGQKVDGSIQNYNNSKILSWNTSFVLKEFFDSIELQCNVVQLEHNHNMTTGVRLHWNKAISEASLQTTVLITASAILSIIISGLIIWLCVKKNHQTKLEFAPEKLQKEPLYENTNKEEITMTDVLVTEKKEVIYAELRFQNDQITEAKEMKPHDRTTYAHIVLP